MATHALSGAAATLAIARVTLRRALRSRTVWWAAAVAALPVVLAVLLDALGHRSWRVVAELGHASAAVVAAILVAGPIGEELEDRTIAYLWSRPLPRWSLVTGKLVALAPLAALLVAGGVAIALARSGTGPDPSIQRIATAAAIATCARAALAAAIATLVPRHALALTIAYLSSVDFVLAAIPARLQVLSIWFHDSAVGGLDSGESVTTGVIALAVTTAIMLAVALWRVRRIE